jgi:type IV secretion system protein VirB10
MDEATLVDRRESPGPSLARRYQAYLWVGVAVFAAVALYMANRASQRQREQQQAEEKSRVAQDTVMLDRMAEQQRRQADTYRNGTLDQQQPTTDPAQSTERRAMYGAGGASASEDGGDERARRAHSRFAPSLAVNLAGRSGGPGIPLGRPGAPTGASGLLGALEDLRAGRGPSLPPPPPEEPRAAARADTRPATQERPAPPNSTEERNRARGPAYLVPEGTILQAVLLTRLEGERPGRVKCMVGTDVYSHDLLHVLIPAGTILLGDAARVDSTGQTRLAVAFHRALMPDLFSVDLDQMPALEPAGATGLKDQVNNHYLRIFGASIAVGALGGLSNLGSSGASLVGGTSLVDSYRAGVGASMGQSATRILDNMLNTLPSVTIREGHPIDVFITRDLTLPAYDAHQMSPNL